jgi:hypothetical protein
MHVRVTWAWLALAWPIVAFSDEPSVDTTTVLKIPTQATSLAPATPSRPVAPAQPAAPPQPTGPATVPVVATTPNVPTPTGTAVTPNASTKLDMEYFCQTVAADGDHRTKYVSRVFESLATSQSLTNAWLGYLQSNYHVDRAASGSCARVAKTFEQTLPDREKQWQSMSLNVVHVDWKG